MASRLCCENVEEVVTHKCTGDALGFRAPSQGGQPRQGHSSAERCRPGIRIGSSSTRCARRRIRCSLELDDSIHSTLSASNERRSTESSLGIYLQLGMQCAARTGRNLDSARASALSQVLWQRQHGGGPHHRTPQKEDKNEGKRAKTNVDKQQEDLAVAHRSPSSVGPLQIHCHDLCDSMLFRACIRC